MIKELIYMNIWIFLFINFITRSKIILKIKIIIFNFYFKYVIFDNNIDCYSAYVKRKIAPYNSKDKLNIERDISKEFLCKL
jgi:hypothetical protein